jgi:hypothetical protein
VEINLHLNDPVVAFVKQLLPSVVVESDTKPEPGIQGPSYHIDLPTAAGAEYRFILWLGGNERQISARLLTAEENAHFWYMPFEKLLGNSPQQLTKTFLDTVELIVRHKTRIEQKRGLFFNHFRCDYYSPNGWKRIYGLSALRWIRVPKIKEQRHIYQSASLVSHV